MTWIGEAQMIFRTDVSAASAARLFAVLAALSLTACETTSTPHEIAIHTIEVEGAPKAVGPYSQGVVAKGFLFAAGQVPRDPATGNLVAGDIVAQTNRVIDNLEAVLKGGGCTLEDVVKVNVYMTDLSDFAKMNDAYAARFGGHRPARTTVQVAKLPGGAQLEMDVVAQVHR
jgi:2-iminobutanoate/2-iminopropanoate deaminase